MSRRLLLLLALAAAGLGVVPGAGADDDHLRLSAAFADDGVTVHLSWQTVDDGDVVERTGGDYSVVREPGGVAVVRTTKTHARDRVVDDGSVYTWTVTDEDSGERASARLSTAPERPTNVTAIAIPGVVTLAWRNPDDVAGILVRRRDDGTGEPPCAARPDEGVAVGASTPRRIQVDTDVTGTTYCYSVFALDGAGNASEPGTVRVRAIAARDTTPPGAVTALDADGSVAGRVWLTWANPPDADLDATVVRRLSDGTATPPCPGRTDGVAVGADLVRTEQVDESVEPGRAYCYAVFAADRSGNVSQAATVRVTARDAVGPDLVHGLEVTAPAPGAVLLTWSNPADADLDAIVVRRTSDGTAAPPCPASPADGTAVGGRAVRTSQGETGLRGGRSLCYGVFAIDGSGNSSPAAVVSVTTTGAADPPNPPRDVHAFVRLDGQVIVSWANPQGEALASVVVRRTSDGSARPRCARSVGDGKPVGGTAVRTRAVDDAARAGRTYCYAVFAVDGDGRRSDGARTRAVRPPNVANLQASAGCTAATLHWRTPSDRRLARVQVVRRGRGIPQGPTDGRVVDHRGGEARSRGLDRFSSYSFRVYTVYRTGDSEQPLVYSSGAVRTVRTGRVCRPEDGARIGDRTPTIDWSPHSAANRYAILLQHRGRTMMVRFPFRSQWAVRSSWRYKGSVRSLRRGNAYTAYVYAYTDARPRGVLIGSSAFSVRG